MRYQILFFLIFINSFFAFSQQATGKKIYLNKGNDNGCLFPAGLDYKPGDTLVVRASLNPWSYIYLGNVIGNEQKPIVVINEGNVELSAGFDIDNCQYLKITGCGTKEKYGFHINKGGTAVSIHGKSAHIEAERFYASECTFGCWIKNEASCDSSVTSWILNYMSIHDFEMRDIKIEGFYMGSTDPNNIDRPVTCNGVQQFNKPSKLGNIKVYNGLINGTGRPAILLSNASIGLSEIYNNVVYNAGREFNEQQGTGISLGLYTRALVHHNTIKNTYTWGIVSLGGTWVRIEKNQIDSSGYLDGKTLDWPQNIAIDTRATNPVDSTQFIVLDNMLNNPGKSSRNIEVWKTLSTYSSENIICNNLSNGKPASLTVDPGISWRNCNLFHSAASPGLSQRKLFFFSAAAILGIALIYFAARGRYHKKAVRTISI